MHTYMDPEVLNVFEHEIAGMTAEDANLLASATSELSKIAVQKTLEKTGNIQKPIGPAIPPGTGAPPPAAKEPSFLDKMSRNPLPYVAGGLGIVAVVLIAVKLLRK